jgi:hypothetical protein
MVKGEESVDVPREWKTVRFPVTSPTLYVSGKTALNLHLPDDTSGDWHPYGNVILDARAEDRDAFLCGEGMPRERDTNRFFGTYGIRECSELMGYWRYPHEGKLYYVAEHQRAILDLVHFAVCLGSGLNGIRFMTVEFLDTEDERDDVLSMASRMHDHLDERQRSFLLDWINHERQLEM